MKIVLLTFLFQTDCTSLLDISTYRLQRIEPKERFLLISWIFGKFSKIENWSDPVRESPNFRPVNFGSDRINFRPKSRTTAVHRTKSDRFSYLVRSVHPRFFVRLSKNIMSKNRVQVFQMFVEWNRLC